MGSSREVLAPFLECGSPSEFVELQRTVDMGRVVEALEDWDAVRLGALGPLRGEGAQALTRKRAAFLVTATEQYGTAYAEVLALFVLHTAFDDEVRQLLQALAREKQLDETLGAMGSVREELKRRGLPLTSVRDRGEQAGDVLRGLGRAARDSLSSNGLSDGARYLDLTAKVKQMPPPYQEAFEQVKAEVMEEHYAPRRVVLGGFDHLSFGVPLGFYSLVEGTGQGVGALAKGKYEQATRALAPAALLVALYAGGKGARALEGAGGARASLVPSLEGLKVAVRRLEERLGGAAIRDLHRYIQASREGALVAAEWGEAGALALYEARGNAAKAQAVLSEAHSQRAKPTATVAGEARSGGGLGAGLAKEVVEAKLLQAELEARGPRLPADAEYLKKQSVSLESPPAGGEGGLWSEYVRYRQKRLAEVEAGEAVKGPLKWEGYVEMRGIFARGLDFERRIVAKLEADAALPRAQRRWLKGFEKPRIETHVGVKKTDLRYVDVLVMEEKLAGGLPRRVETFSFKSRNLKPLKPEELSKQMITDARDALRYYGERLQIRRPGLMVETEVQSVHLIYEGGGLQPGNPQLLQEALKRVRREANGVEVSIQ